MFTCERITTPRPILAPKARSTAQRKRDGWGNHGSKKIVRANHHSTSFQKGAPLENSGFW
jgi:hypothetical protein